MESPEVQCRKRWRWVLWVPVLLQVCGGVCWMAPIWTEVGGTAEVSLPFTAAAALTNLEVSRVVGPPSSHGSRRWSRVHYFLLLTKGTKGLVDSGGYDVRDSAAASFWGFILMSPAPSPPGRARPGGEPHLVDLSLSRSSTPVLCISVKTSRVWFGVGCTPGGLSAWACEV